MDKKQAIKRVWTPMKKAPCYALQADATPEEMRAMAVKAMVDELTVQWYSKEDFIYVNKAGQEMHVRNDEVYSGMLYATSATSLFHWLHYYDPETGRMGGLGPDVMGKMGNTCASSVFWGWYGVVSSIRGCYTFHMTPANGFLPVGGYVIDPRATDFHDYTTDRIIEDNGRDKIIAAYAQARPGDAVVAFKDAKSSHAQMVVEPATVVYREGKIDLDESYLVVQDQHKGLRSDKTEFVYYYQGGKVHFAGHLAMKRPFSKLLKEAYLPLTNAEFEGKKPYTVPAASAEGKEIKTLADVKELTVSATHPIIRVKLVVRDGERVLGESELLTTKENMIDNTAFRLPLTALPLPELKGATGRLTLEVLLGSGTTHIVADAAINA